MEAWDISAKTSIIRSVMIHFVPLFFHWLDITTNQQQLIQSYVVSPRACVVGCSICCGAAWVMVD
jgi:hypothetical protein